MNDKIFIVGIELNSISAKQKFESSLTQLGSKSHIEITSGVYAIKLPYMYTAEMVRNQISSIFSNNCRLFVMKSSIEAAWNINPNADLWLKSNI